MQTVLMAMNDPKAITLAIHILKDGGLVAFPTDTVYGLGALVFNDQAVSKISDVKGRSTEKAIPILIADTDQLKLVAAEINNDHNKLARHFWPGPLTIVFPRNSDIPDAVTPLPTVGIRVPNLQHTIGLLQLAGPMAVSSANLTGRGSSSTAQGVQSQLDGKISLILDGGVTPGGIPSTVIEVIDGKPHIFREGPITLEEILRELA